MKIGIVGTGNVGSTAAYTIITQGIADELVMIDYNLDRAKAEAKDILDATSLFQYNKVKQGTYKDLDNADIVVITAGAGRKPGQTRTDLLKINIEIFKSIIPEIAKNAPNSIIIIASNPADIMAYSTLKMSGFSTNKIIGTGTALDSARFRAEIAQYLDLPAKSITANVVGEHGDTQVPLWSSAKIGDIIVTDYATSKNKTIDEKLQEEMTNNIVKAGQFIIQGKGATFYGIGASIARICKAIKEDENSIIPVASLHKNIEGIENVFLSLPTMVGRNGIREVIMPSMNHKEKELLKKSAKAIKENMNIVEAEI